MRSISILPIALIILSTQLSSCKKESTPASDELVPLTVEFDNIVDGENLFLNTVTYKNNKGEDYTISRLQYFISNISLVRSDGTEYVVPADSSYFLIRESDPDTRFARVMVPVGDYNMVKFIVGVDSLRSTMDVSQRTGVLDPTAGMDDGMYWSWNSGYIFFKMEGDSPSAPLDPSGYHKFRFHIGGFGGYTTPGINNIRKVSIDLRASGPALVRTGRKSNIHLMADIAKVMDGSTQVSLAENSTVMFGDYSSKIADNYTQVFFHDHTEN